MNILEVLSDNYKDFISVPFESSTPYQDAIIAFEQRAYAHYPNQKGIEDTELFRDFYLVKKDPVINRHYMPGTSQLYLYGNPLYALAAFFLSDFRSGILWQGVKIEGVAIVARKMMSVVSTNAYHDGTLKQRLSLLEYITYIKSLNLFPDNQNFTLIGHFQPDSYRLLHKLFNNRKTLAMLRLLKISGLSRLEISTKYPGIDSSWLTFVERCPMETLSSIRFNSKPDDETNTTGFIWISFKI